MTHSTHSRPPVCGERESLPAHLVGKALELTKPAGATRPEEVESNLRCMLEAHMTGDHYALVVELPGADTGSVWTRWIRGHLPTSLIVLPDCPATDTSSREPCCEFAGHPGGHSYQLTDPWHAIGTGVR